LKFVLTYEVPYDTRDEAIKRFRKTQGAAPSGITLLGRWHRADVSAGYVLVETNDPAAIADFALEWSDVLRLTATPVIEDMQLAAAFETLSKK
jgi:hypothetical protein